MKRGGREVGQSDSSGPVCECRNWIAPPDNDKVMCSNNSQVQSSTYLCSVELASDCLRG